MKEEKLRGGSFLDYQNQAPRDFSTRTKSHTMSIKRTYRSGPSFSLFSDGFEDDSISLELNGCEFCATEWSVSVKIPISVWEYIRDVSPVDLSLAKLSDKDLRRLVAKQHKKHERVPKDDSILASLACSVWGEGTPAQKIQNAMSWYKKERDKQKKILVEIDALRSHAKSAAVSMRQSGKNGQGERNSLGATKTRPLKR